MDDEGPTYDTDNPAAVIAHIARETGCLPPAPTDGDAPVVEHEDDASPHDRVCELLGTIGALRRDIEKVEADLQRRRLDRVHADITSTVEQERRRVTLSSMVGHVTSTLDTKDTLVDRLQKPFVGDHLVIEAQYQRALVTLLPRVATSLTDYTKNMDLLAWGKDAESQIQRLEEALAQVKATTAAVATVLRVRHDCRRTVRGFLKQAAVIKNI